VRLVVALIRLMMTSSEVSGLARQLRLMKLNRRCSVLCVPRTLKEARCRRSGLIEGGTVPEMEELGRVVWWPSAAVLQGRAANRPGLLRSRAVVVSVVGKVAP